MIVVIVVLLSILGIYLYIKGRKKRGYSYNST
jgi:hypothetical protein